MKRKLSESSGYSSIKRIKLANEEVLQSKQKIMPSVVANTCLSRSLRLGGNKAQKHNECLNRVNRKHNKTKIESAPSVGTVIEDRYRVEKLLGKGSFGFVCACSDILASNLKVAIKFLKFLEDDESTLNEITILQEIAENDVNDISHCIRPIDLFQDSLNYQDCLVFPMYSSNLFEFIKTNHFVPFSLSETKTLITQVIEATNFLHSLHIIHTDLKPENILLVDNTFLMCEKDGRKYKKLVNLSIKIIDFGMAVKGSIHKHHCQTRHYRAPEVILEQEWSFGIDMWSVGCILYELITGEAVFMPETTYEHLYIIEHFLGNFSQTVINRCSKDVRQKYFKSNGELRKNDLKIHVKPLKKLYKYDKFSDVIDLIKKLIVCNFKKRYSAKDALNHPFLTNK